MCAWKEAVMAFDRITPDSIKLLVGAFYAKVRGDAQLAPIFGEALGEEWDFHLAKMCEFWCAAMRVSGRYQGDILDVHRRLPALRPVLFVRWLELFEQTVDEYFTDTASAALRDRAGKTARNLQLALFHRPQAENCYASPNSRGTSGIRRDEDTGVARPSYEGHTRPPVVDLLPVWENSRKGIL
jgi:hemoglobin